MSIQLASSGCQLTVIVYGYVSTRDSFQWSMALLQSIRVRCLSMNLKAVHALLFTAVLLLLVACGGESQATPEEVTPPVPTATSTPTATPTPTPAPSPTPKPMGGHDCQLTGGEIVAEGWSGKDTGANYCNQCMCIGGKMACPPPTLTLTPTPTATSTP